MPTRRLALLLTLMLSGAAAPVPAGAAAGDAGLPFADSPARGIKGEDDRIQVDARAYPWSAIGRLTKGDGSLCTAVLIGPATALTASHCLWNDRTGAWMPASAIFLTLGWEVGEWTAATQVERVDLPPDASAPRRDAPLARMAGDWAVLRLAAPVGRTVGWLDVAPLDLASYHAMVARRPVVLQAGYSADRRHVLTGHVGCHIHGWVADGVLAHDCDATRGDSGSPLFAWLDGRFQVLGTHVSSFSTDGTVYGAAIAGGGLSGLAGAGASAGAAPLDRDLMAVLSRLAGTSPP
ncbi:trypsin-like serine peptidase [Novispirillum sp. DQ9]|uniref:trypsin-like serine peptidase n=1 Tax=Novispirillum sp. DQ9 TaxID=3398612 RepID=UPI003C7A6B0F